MIMRARQDGNILIFELEGHLDFETTQAFEETCAGLIRKSDTQRVVFNLERLKFVGSSGINQFIRVLKDFNQLERRPKLCHLSSEFVKVFRAYQTARSPFEIFETENAALESFTLSPDSGTAPKKATRKASPRKKTIQQ